MILTNEKKHGNNCTSDLKNYLAIAVIVLAIYTIFTVDGDILITTVLHCGFVFSFHFEKLLALFFSLLCRFRVGGRRRWLLQWNI
jgi:hypothetical protein